MDTAGSLFCSLRPLVLHPRTLPSLREAYGVLCRLNDHRVNFNDIDLHAREVMRKEERQCSSTKAYTEGSAWLSRVMGQC